MRTSYPASEAIIAKDATASGASAQFSPHVVLLDLDLPDINGYEVCERIRAERTALTPKIIVVSGHGRSEARKRANERLTPVQMISC